MAIKTWTEVTQSPEFQKQTVEKQQQIANDYYDSVVAPKVKAAGKDVNGVKLEFQTQALNGVPNIDTGKSNVQKVGRAIGDVFTGIGEGTKHALDVLGTKVGGMTGQTPSEHDNLAAKADDVYNARLKQHVETGAFNAGIETAKVGAGITTNIINTPTVLAGMTGLPKKYEDKYTIDRGSFNTPTTTTGKVAEVLGTLAVPVGEVGEVATLGKGVKALRELPAVERAAKAVKELPGVEKAVEVAKPVVEKLSPTSLRSATTKAEKIPVIGKPIAKVGRTVITTGENAIKGAPRMTVETAATSENSREAKNNLGTNIALGAVGETALSNSRQLKALSGKIKKANELKAEADRLATIVNKHALAKKNLSPKESEARFEAFNKADREAKKAQRAYVNHLEKHKLATFTDKQLKSLEETGMMPETGTTYSIRSERAQDLLNANRKSKSSVGNEWLDKSLNKDQFNAIHGIGLTGGERAAQVVGNLPLMKQLGLSSVNIEQKAAPEVLKRYESKVNSTDKLINAKHADVNKQYDDLKSEINSLETSANKALNVKKVASLKKQLEKVERSKKFYDAAKQHHEALKEVGSHFNEGEIKAAAKKAKDLRFKMVESSKGDMKAFDEASRKVQKSLFETNRTGQTFGKLLGEKDIAKSALHGLEHRLHMGHLIAGLASGGVGHATAGLVGGVGGIIGLAAARKGGKEFSKLSRRVALEDTAAALAGKYQKGGRNIPAAVLLSNKDLSTIENVEQNHPEIANHLANEVSKPTNTPVSPAEVVSNAVHSAEKQGVEVKPELKVAVKQYDTLRNTMQDAIAKNMDAIATANLINHWMANNYNTGEPMSVVKFQQMQQKAWKYADHVASHHRK